MAGVRADARKNITYDGGLEISMCKWLRYPVSFQQARLWFENSSVWSCVVLGNWEMVENVRRDHCGLMGWGVMRCIMCQQVVDPPDRPLPELYFDCKWAIGILDADIRFVNLWIYGGEEAGGKVCHFVEVT
jgi:hypothetical protein